MPSRRTLLTRRQRTQLLLFAGKHSKLLLNKKFPFLCFSNRARKAQASVRERVTNIPSSPCGGNVKAGSARGTFRNNAAFSLLGGEILGRTGSLPSSKMWERKMKQYLIFV